MSKKSNMKPVQVWIPKKDIEDLDKLVDLKFYPNRNEAIRFAIHDLVRREDAKSNQEVR